MSDAYLESVIAEISERIRSVATAKAADCLYEVEPAKLAEFAFGDTDTFWLVQAGVDWAADKGESPLNLLVCDACSGQVLFQVDPIAEAIKLHEDAESLDWLHKAIESLQSGIDRLKAYEAERLEAQP